MTTDEAVAIVNEYLHVDGRITHKGDELKCVVDGDKSYLGADECNDLSNAFRQLATALRQSAGKP